MLDIDDAVMYYGILDTGTNLLYIIYFQFLSVTWFVFFNLIIVSVVLKVLNL